MGGGDWIDCRAAIVPAAAWRSLDFRGEPFAAIHVEPTIGRLPALTSLLRDSWVGDALSELLRYSARRSSAADLAPPLRNVVELLHQRRADPTPVEHYARIAGLSSSRFQHLFTREVNVPFRRYRAWSRLRFACRRIGKGQSVTAAAHESGFFDSAHFAHEFRRTFGKRFATSCRHIQRLGRAPADGKIDRR
jgi:AraC-like DNA-binding protein